MLTTSRRRSVFLVVAALVEESMGLELNKGEPRQAEQMWLGPYLEPQESEVDE